MSKVSHSAINALGGPCFGRKYTVQGEQRPEFRLPRGWWLLPAVVGGAAGWVGLFVALIW